MYATQEDGSARESIISWVLEDAGRDAVHNPSIRDICQYATATAFVGAQAALILEFF